MYVEFVNFPKSPLGLDTIPQITEIDGRNVINLPFTKKEFLIMPGNNEGTVTHCMGNFVYTRTLFEFKVLYKGDFYLVLTYISRDKRIDVKLIPVHTDS